jgi:predicted MFS family arabinose efflux permease
VVFSVGAAGFVVGAALSEKVGRRLGVGPSLAVGALVQGIPFVLVPLAPRSTPVPFFLAAFLIEASANPIFNVTQVSLRQTLTPPGLQGRMNASMRFLVWGTLPVGSLVGGALGGWIGLRPTLWVAAVGTALSSLPVVVSPLWRMRMMPLGPTVTQPMRAGGTIVIRPEPFPEDSLDR